jgi:hypothetical protein
MELEGYVTAKVSSCKQNLQANHMIGAEMVMKAGWIFSKIQLITKEKRSN